MPCAVVWTEVIKALAEPSVWNGVGLEVLEGADRVVLGTLPSRPEHGVKTECWDQQCLPHQQPASHPPSAHMVLPLDCVTRLTSPIHSLRYF